MQSRYKEMWGYDGDGVRCKMKRAGQNMKQVWMQAAVRLQDGAAGGNCDTAAGTGVKADTDVKVSLIARLRMAWGCGL